jgi:hypothetical protein
MKTSRGHFLAYFCISAVLILTAIGFYLSENVFPFFICYFSGLLCVLYGGIKVANRNAQLIGK